jgi:hypothetical protein
MSTFISALPAPRHATIDEDDDEDFFAMQAARGGAPAPARKKIPPYGARAGFIPRSNEDFGEGGAYPEVRRPLPSRSLLESHLHSALASQRNARINAAVPGARSAISAQHGQVTTPHFH